MASRRRFSLTKGVAGHPESKDVTLRSMTLADKRIRPLAKFVGGAGTIAGQPPPCLRQLPAIASVIASAGPGRLGERARRCFPPPCADVFPLRRGDFA